MQYQQLGRSQLQISKTGLGCMSLKAGQPMNERILHEAVHLGINFFDTADLYDKGMNEELIGNALKIHRNKIILATKVGNQWRKDGSGWGWNPRKEYILAAVEKSLQRLQASHIDLYQLHGGTIDDPVDETIETFELLVKQGKIRYYGISSIRPNVIRRWIQYSNMVSVMMQYSLLDRRPEETILPLLQQKNIGVLARGSLAQGLLINKPSKSYLNYSEEEVKKAATAVQTISNKKRNAAQTALQFVLHNPSVASAITGIRTMDQLVEAVNTTEAPALSEKEMKLLQDSIAVNFYKEHR